MSTFKFAGVSRREGVIKARFANDSGRVKVLVKGGHSDIDIIELKEPMTKEAAVAFLISIDFDNGNAEIRGALEAELTKRVPGDKPTKPTKAPKAPKVAKDKKAKPSLSAIAARAKTPSGLATADLTAAINSMIKPASTLSKAEILAQLADIEDAPF
jgi:hypothetical protein